MKTNISPFRIIPIAIFIFCLAGCDSSTIAEGAAREADRKCEAEQNFDLCINACKTGVEAARAEAVKAKLTFSSSDEEKETALEAAKNGCNSVAWNYRENCLNGVEYFIANLNGY